MMKEKEIRAIIPFVIVFLSTFFLADADLFENFGTRLDMLKSNARLLWLLVTGDGMQAVGSLIIAIIFFRSWYLNRDKPFWFNDVLWQLSGAFFCWFLVSVISILGTFWLYLWIQGMFRLFTGIFLLYVANTLIAARSMLYHPETPEEAQVKAAKFDELIKIMKK